MENDTKFKPGQSGNPKGKPKGTPNKFTVSVRQAFQEAFHELQLDPYSNLLEWGKLNPTEFYKLASKLIPIAQELTGKDGSPLSFEPIQIVVTIPDNGRSAPEFKE